MELAVAEEPALPEVLVGLRQPLTRWRRSEPPSPAPSLAAATKR